MPDNQQISDQTQQWIRSFIIGLNLCPFAKREMDRNSVKIQVSAATTHEDGLADFIQELLYLDSTPSTETTLLVYPNMLQDFFDYLDFTDLAESTLLKANYEGIYQVATFHPNYCFADTTFDDVTNYTNRSPYPMLHLLREESVEKAIAFYGDTEEIPENNMKKLRDLGLKEVLKLAKDSKSDESS